MKWPEPGSYGVVQNPGIIPAGIRAATRSNYDHAFIVGYGDDIIEAWPHTGVRIGSLSAYLDGRPILFSNDILTNEQRGKIVNYALANLGIPYDYISFALLTLKYVFKISVPFSYNSVLSAICSHFVIRAGQAGGVDWTTGLSPSKITPSILAQRLYSV